MLLLIVSAVVLFTIAGVFFGGLAGLLAYPGDLLAEWLEGHLSELKASWRISCGE
jgi:hypothetical protein